MADGPSPFFTTFEEAWSWFEDGGELVGIDDQRDTFLQGRAQLLAFQATIGEMAIADEIVELQDQLRDISGLLITPRDLLHITLRIVGFQVIAKSRPTDVLRQDVGRVAERAAAALQGVGARELTAGPVSVFPDALMLEIRPIEPLREIVRTLDEAGNAGGAGFAVESYLPHITIAAFRDAGEAPDLRKRLPALRALPPFACTLGRLELARWWFTGDDTAASPELEIIRSYRLQRDT